LKVGHLGLEVSCAKGYERLKNAGKVWKIKLRSRYR
jgi:hypothetical protein